MQGLDTGWLHTKFSDNPIVARNQPEICTPGVVAMLYWKCQTYPADFLR